MLSELARRHFNISLYPNIAHDNVERTITFPLYNLSGQYLGYQQYRPNADKVRKNHPKLGRHFTYIPKGSAAIWGIDVLDKRDKRIFITEGIFKSCRFHNYGLNSLAVLGNNPKHLKEWFKLLSCYYEIICICDEDNAGAALTKFGDKFIYKTIDDLSEKEFAAFLKINNII